MALQPVFRESERVGERSNGYRDGGSYEAQWVEREEGEGADRMEEDTELEEGEALEAGPPLDDLDSRFDYLDTKIEAVLGHCQKEFQGSLYPDRLGSRYGGYGTFLPTHVRGAPVLAGAPPSQPSDPSRSRPSEGQVERARRMPGGGSGAVSDRARKVSPSNTGAKNHMQSNGQSHFAEGLPTAVMKGHSTKDGGFLDQKKDRGLTLRINLQKQGVDKNEKKAMYNGFGLDHSSSVSADDDQDDEAVPASEDEVSPDRSPLDMIRIMTSHQLPHGGLLSPLLARLSEPLERKERPVSVTKSNKKLATGSLAKAELGVSSVSLRNDSDLGKDTRVVKEKKERISEKVKNRPLERKEGAQPFDNVKVGKKDMESNTRIAKESGANAVDTSHRLPARDGPRDFELKPEKSDRDFVVESRDVAGKEVDNSKDLARSSWKNKMVSLESLQEEEMELPVMESRDVRRVKEDSTRESKKSRDVSVEANLTDISTRDLGKEKRKPSGNKDIPKARKEEGAPKKDVRKQQSRKEKEVGKPVACEPVVPDKEITREGLPEVQKKGKESMKVPHAQKEVKEKVKDVLKDTRKEIKKDTLKKEFMKDVDDSRKEELREFSKSSVRDKEVSKDLGKRDGIDQGLKEVKGGKKAAKKVGKEPKLSSKEQDREIGLARDFLGPAGNGRGLQAPASQPLLPFTAGTSNAETPAGAILPVGQLVLDNWVECVKCKQWRLLVPGVDLAELPEKWQCKMMTWLPDLNSCKFLEDVTTAAVYSFLGFQYPALVQTNPGVQMQPPPLVPAFPPPAEPMLDSRPLESKPAKVQRSNSKKSMGKKVGGGSSRPSTPSVKRMEMGSVKSKSLNDVVQHPAERLLERSVMDTGTADDVGYTRVMAEKRKLKEKEKLKRMRVNEGDDIRPLKQTVREEERRALNRAGQDHEWGHPGKASVKLPVLLETDNVADVNASIYGGEPEASKPQKGKFHDVGKADNAGVKRKKKTDSSQENEELRSVKKYKGEEARNLKGAEATARQKAPADNGDTHSLQYFSDEDAMREGEFGDQTVARSATVSKSLKKVKLTSAAIRDVKNDPKRQDRQEARGGDRKVKDHQKFLDVKCRRDVFEKHESSDSDKDKRYEDNPGRSMGDRGVRRKAESKVKDGQTDAKKRLKADEFGAGHPTEKRQMVSKNEVKSSGAARELVDEEKKVHTKRMNVSSEKIVHHADMEEQSPLAVEVGKDADKRGKKTRLYDIIPGVVHAHLPPLHERADESPNVESRLPDMGMYSEEAGQETHRRGSQPHSPSSSSCKVSYSAESSAFGSKGGSPIESTVSSSPVRSSKVDTAATARGVTEAVQNNHIIPLNHQSDKHNSLSPSPKRSIDQDADVQSDREGGLRQSHRGWDDRPHSSEPERDFRNSGRDSVRDTSSGRAREDRYARSNSREGGEFRRYDRSRNGRDDDRYWDEARETRAGSASYFPERYDRHRDDRYRDRENSVDRYRDRENRYERRTNRDDRFREHDRERGRERDRSRENWPSDRGGDGREERYSRERSVRQDWGRPRESRLDKQGSLNWRDESKQGRDVGREGRDRVEDENIENKHDIRSNSLQGGKDEHPGGDEHDVAPDMQKDDSEYRYEKNDGGPPKDEKLQYVRVPPQSQAPHGWDGDRIGVPSSGRKDLDVTTSRNGVEGQIMATIVNSRSRVEGHQSGPGTMSARGKGGQVDGTAFDARLVEGGKQGKEHKIGAEDDPLMRLSSTKITGSSVHMIRGTEGASASPSKKEHAAIAQGLIKEAKDLKHSTDRMKSAEGESTNLYLQAALKFLQAAHHLEMASVESVRQGDTQSMQMYNDTAKLCDFCATAYERQKDLAAAALGHICAAVARFRVMMAKSASLNKDCLELQSGANATQAPGAQVVAVQTPPTGLPPPHPSRASEKPGSSHGVGAPSTVGESPSSSSASDVDNLNNHPSAGDKGLAANAVKGTALSPLPGSSGSCTDIVPPRLHPNFHRVVRNGLDVHVMLESWTKAQNATAAAETAYAGIPRKLEGMLAVRRVGEIGLLGNMDAVVQQVRQALEAIGH